MNPPRRRSYENKDLPTGLYVKKVRGKNRFIFRRPDGAEIWFPSETQRLHAIQAALAYNAKHRNATEINLAKNDKYNGMLSHWMPKVIARVKQEEFAVGKISKDTFATFLSDCEKLKKCIGHVNTKSITLAHVNDFLEYAAVGKSNNVYNRKISFLSKVFTYLVDESAMPENIAAKKKAKPKDKKVRTRLKAEDLKLMLETAKNDRKLFWLYIAMSLSLQTTHAVLEVSRIKYSHIKNGYLRIHRQKVQHKEASRVEIPLTFELQKVVEDSKKSRLVCPYIVHRKSKIANQIGEGCIHPFQVSSKYISRQFSKLRDKLGIAAELPPAARPTFHEIRALSIHLFAKAGVDPQSRAAHSDAKTTRIYKEGHVEWVQVPAAEIKL